MQIKEGSSRSESLNLNLRMLINDTNLQYKYKTEIDKRLKNVNIEHNPNDIMNLIADNIKEAAKNTIPKTEKNKSTESSLEFKDLILKRNAIIQRIKNDKRTKNRKEERKRLKETQNKIKEKRKEEETKYAQEIIEEINKCRDDSHKMFKAVKELKMGHNNKKASIKVRNADNMFLLSDKSKAEEIARWFEEKFKDPEGPLETFEGIRPLERPITATEIRKAIKKLKCNRSTGPDLIPNELLKHSGHLFETLFANVINKSFETAKRIDCLTLGTLCPLPKPNKEQGPISNLRPIILLNGMRKIMSLVTLNRIEKKLDQYIGPFLHGYQAEQSCEGIVWAQKILTSVVLRKKWQYSKMGVDLSRAFDTIRRRTILRLLKDAGCTDDEVALVRYLLSGTKMTIKVKKTASRTFEVSLGSGQGDSISGKLFTLYLAGALNHVRAILSRPNPPFSSQLMPLEFGYVDDIDFLSEDTNELHEILPKIKTVFDEWSLTLNPDKTDHQTFQLSNDPSLRGAENWRNSKVLGSQSCTVKEIQRRCNLGNVAFSKFEKLWVHGKTLDKKVLIQIYDATVVSIMMYNCGTWAATKRDFEKLDACHRNHIRKFLGIHWTDKIKNETIYEEHDITKLSTRTRKARWNLLGKVLRQDSTRPAKLALIFALRKMKEGESRLGRPITNLLDTLKKDIKETGLKMESVEDLQELEDKAADKSQWNAIICQTSTS